MRRFAIIMAALLAAPAAGAQEQSATAAETALLAEIATCLATGLPSDWRQAEMIVELAKPGAETGTARYLVMRNLSGGQYESFAPCIDFQPARRLTTELRKLQPAERRDWKGARFVVYSDGKFDLTLDYSK